MRKATTEILVIGGGATGTGIVRDLAMRGFRTILVEKRDLSHGTTGRYHGLLHSGGRYVVKDQEAAIECIRENRVLRRIMPQCIEDTSGFFVTTPWDDPTYADRFAQGCKAAGIPVEEIKPRQMLQKEPRLNPNIQRCFMVPDATADSFLASELNAASARLYGAEILNYHEIHHLIRYNDQITGALCHDLVKDEMIEISCDLVVNAAGAWVGKIAKTVGIEVQIQPGKGTMVALNHRIVNTVINRCKMPSDGDIIVPIHTVSVIGTTDIQVADPDHISVEPWEIRLMLSEGEKVIPGFAQHRMLRVWAGVRPLFQETKTDNSRDISRAYALLDHATRDGIEGMVTITSGKWTTYRMMAESTTDLICKKLSTSRPCRTHLEPLPEAKSSSYYHLGHRLEQIEKEASFGSIFCECELATKSQVSEAIIQGDAKTLDDIRREVRLGMGPCQGGFCTFRAAGLLQSIRHHPVEENNSALRDFFQERWKGVAPVLWGSQLRQERLNEFIYRNVLNIDHLPGPLSSKLAAEMYEPHGAEDKHPDIAWSSIIKKDETPLSFANTESTSLPVDVLVIGAGLAGLVTAWQAAKAGLKTRVISKGWGATHWHSGCVDVLGYYPDGPDNPELELRQAIQKIVRENPSHPYTMIGIDQIEASLEEFKGLCERSGYPLRGSLDSNWRLPSGVGATRPTCLAPETMIAGDLNRHEPMLIVGIEGFHDFYPEWIAGNLNKQGIIAESVVITLPSLIKRRTLYPLTLARLFETEEFRAEFVAELISKQGSFPRIGLPAVLGIDQANSVQKQIEKQTGCEIFEIPSLPPSVPGIRLHNLLVKAIRERGGEVFNGMQITSYKDELDLLSSVTSESAARDLNHRADKFVLATGGILGGGFCATPDNCLHEMCLNLDLSPNIIREEWFSNQFFDPDGHPIFHTGIPVDTSFHPLGQDRKIRYRNVYIVGSTLAGGDFIKERSYEGIAISTGFAVGKVLVG